MPDGRFESLRLELLRRGVSPLYVDRTIVELGEHHADLKRAALAAGFSVAEAEWEACAALGSDRAIAAAVLAHPELLTFSTRWPRVAHCLHSAATIGTIPGAPLKFCIEHRPDLARWGAAVGGAVTLMGGIMAALNWLIVLPY